MNESRTTKLRLAWLAALDIQAAASAEHDQLRDLLKKYPGDRPLLKKFEAAKIEYDKAHINQEKAWLVFKDSITAAQ